LDSCRLARASHAFLKPTKDDASRIGFDEGPVYESSYEYLRDRGIEVKRGVMREEAVKAFDLYKERGGIIYNG
jgi:hypothetical protein